MPTIPHLFILSLFCITTLDSSFVLANTNIIPKSQQRSDDPYFIRPGNESDYEALLAFKSQISDHPYSVLNSRWNNSLHHCEWEGVLCGRRHRRVVGLSLHSSNLAGTLSPFIGNLSFLRQLHLSNNSFRGNIPHQVSHLTRLRVLYLYLNSFQGEIPANLSRCLHLTTLVLSRNNLVGRIPDFLASLPNLGLLSLHENSLSSDLHGIGFGNTSASLQYVYLSDNKLEGSIPDDIGRTSNSLRGLTLGDNILSGTIPTSLFNLSGLKRLDLSSNKFQGHLPQDLGIRLPNLAYLDLSSNNLVGRIPDKLASLPNLVLLGLFQNSLSGDLHGIGFGNMSNSLQYVYLDQNKLEGSIPDDIGRTSSNSLWGLTLGDNILSGTIPTSLFNLSSLEELDLGHNKIQGHLPQDLGLRLPQLTNLSVSENSLTGQIPTSLSNLSKIVTLQLAYNSFTGGFYLNGNNLPHLSHLVIQYAFSLGSGEARDLSFVDTLTNCTSLTYLEVGWNSFVGTFPHSILNLSTSLTFLSLYGNQISGHIPFGLGKFINLQYLDLSDNHLRGSVPNDMGKLESIEVFDCSNNNLSGAIPSSLGNLTRLSWLYMEDNNLQGSLPKSLGNCTNINYLNVSQNKLSGVLPVELFRASSLILLDISQNNLQGSLPIEISRLKQLVELDVSHNKFSGEIPSTLGGCTSLTILNMSGNSLVGSIPESLSPLKSIQFLDLSCNNLSGRIPSYFPAWPNLLHLNLSFNALEGEVPVTGVFANTSGGVSVAGNSKLCGGMLELHLPRCPSPRRSKKRRLSMKFIVIIPIVCVVIITLLVAFCLYLICSPKNRNDVSSRLQNAKQFPEVSYQMLSRATDGFSQSNLLGVGAFGSVYRGTLDLDDTQVAVAVKVMNLQNRGASKSFMAECNALRNIRHRNLVKIVTVCSSIDTQKNDFKALVYELMPRGSLESWLHSSNHVVTGENVGDNQPCTLTIFQRLSIAIDVACALEYLHIGYGNPIIHCDLKPSNILLDDDMTALVGDFGLAKFLLGDSVSNAVSQSSTTQVRGTVGYAPPEYGLGSKASVEGDIYSYGIVVLEMMTSKKPTDPMFCEGLNLHDFAKSSFPDRVMEIIDRTMFGDANVLRAITGADIRKIECIKSLVRVGVQCSVELPQDRMCISDAVNELKSIGQNLIGIRT